MNDTLFTEVLREFNEDEKGKELLKKINSGAYCWWERTFYLKCPYSSKSINFENCYDRCIKNIFNFCKLVQKANKKDKQLRFKEKKD